MRPDQPLVNHIRSTSIKHRAQFGCPCRSFARWLHGAIGRGRGSATVVRVAASDEMRTAAAVLPALGARRSLLLRDRARADDFWPLGLQLLCRGSSRSCFPHLADPHPETGYGNDDYVGISETDNRYLVSLGLTCNYTCELSVCGEIRQDWQTSAIPGLSSNGRHSAVPRLASRR